MTEREDHRLVEYLYDELPEQEAAAFEREIQQDPELADDAGELRGVLDSLRSLEDEEPSPHLDALILAHARQAAEQQAEVSWWRKLLRGPYAAALVAGTAAVALAVIAVPELHAPRYEEVAQAPVASAPPVETEADLPAAPPAADPAPVDQALPASGDRLAQGRTERAARELLREDADEGGARRGAAGESERAYAEFPAEQKPATRAPAKRAKAAARPAEPEDAFAGLGEGKNAGAGGLGTGGYGRGGGGAKGEASGAAPGMLGGAAGTEQNKDAERRQASKEAAKSEALAKAEPPPPPPAAPRAAAPAASPRAESAPAPARDVEAGEAQDAAEKTVQADAALPPDTIAAAALARAEQLVSERSFDAARRVLLDARVRPSMASTNAWTRLTLRLSRLELDLRRFDPAAVYARQAAASRDPALRREAERLLARIRAEQAPPPAVGSPAGRPPD